MQNIHLPKCEMRLLEIYRRFERAYCLILQEITPQERHGLQWAAGHFFWKGDDKIKSSELNECTQFNKFCKLSEYAVCFPYYTVAHSLPYLHLFTLFTLLYFSTCTLK